MASESMETVERFILMSTDTFPFSGGHLGPHYQEAQIKCLILNKYKVKWHLGWRKQL